MGYAFHVISARFVDGKKLTGPVVPDVQGDGFEINVHQMHFVLIVGHTGSSARCILLRKAKHGVETYERVGYLHPVSYEKWLRISTEHDLVIV
jgi:hypothetical protein